MPIFRKFRLGIRPKAKPSLRVPKDFPLGMAARPLDSRREDRRAGEITPDMPIDMPSIGMIGAIGQDELIGMPGVDVRIPLEKCAYHGKEETYRHPLCGAPLCKKCVDENANCPSCGKDF